MTETEVVMVDLNYNFECYWLILTTTVNAIGLVNCAKTTNCPMITWQVNYWKIEEILNHSQSRKLYIFLVISITKLLIVIGSPRDYFGAIRCFSIFKHIQTTNGADALTLARDFERKSTALARYKKYLAFNHLLKSNGLLPPSLTFTPAIRTKAGYKISK